MAIHPEYILSVLEMLSDYYNIEPTEVQLRVYIERLSGLEPWALKGAAHDWISASPFFPRVSELLGSAARVQPPRPDYLYGEILELEHAFYHDRILDPQAYLDLANRCDRLDRVHTAEHARQRLALFQSMLEQESAEEIATVMSTP